MSGDEVRDEVQSERPPWPVLVAGGLLGLYGLLALTVSLLSFSSASVIVGVIGIVYMLSAYGFWRRNRIARVVVLGFAALEAVGVLLALDRLTAADLLRASIMITISCLVFIPETSRQWFAKR